MVRGGTARKSFRAISHQHAIAAAELRPASVAPDRHGERHLLEFGRSIKYRYPDNDRVREWLLNSCESRQLGAALPGLGDRIRRRVILAAERSALLDGEFWGPARRWPKTRALFKLSFARLTGHRK